MKIQDEQMYHGAALAQIAEDPQFTAINALKISGKNSKSAYKINDSIAVYLKYASRPQGAFKEYNFTFSKAQLSELKKIAELDHALFVAMVCIKDREICCLAYDELTDLIQQRRAAKGSKEDQYTVLCTVKPRQAFRVNMNQPGKRRRISLSPLD